MVVVDASALVEVLVDGEGSFAVQSHLASHRDHVALHLVGVEVLSAIQTLHRLAEVDGTTAMQAVHDLARWPADRAWKLRDNVRAYDAMYVALAEALEVPLLTRDARLARAPGLRCDIQVI